MKARRERGQDASRALIGLGQFFYAWTLIPTYLYLQPNILHYHLVPFVFYAGLINAFSVGRIIIAHLTKSRFPYTNILLLPLFFGVVDSLLPLFGVPSALGPEYQVAFVFLCFGFGIGVYGTFCYDCVITICDYLDIYCLTIKHPKVEDTKKGE